MTERKIMQWYKDNLFPMVNAAIEKKKTENPSLIYTVDWLIAMAYRETWTIIIRYLNAGMTLETMLPVVKGDFNQRPGEKEKIYHGFGFWQIDIGSYPDFIKSGDWKDPYKCCLKAIDVLEEKRKSLSSVDTSDPEYFNRAVTAAYNCGQGNVKRAVLARLGVDHYTHEKNYSQMVWKYRELYNSLT